MTKRKTDLHQEITDRIIKLIEEGTRPWVRGWVTGGKTSAFPLRVTGQPYSGINVLLLWAAQHEGGYEAATWMTFNQAKKLGGMVRKGERGTGIVFASTFEKKDKDTGETEVIPFLKKYTVFNVQQIDGLPEKYDWSEPDELDQGTRPVEELEAFFVATGATINHGGGRAFYSPQSDTITMPPVARFTNAPEYYGTLAHELIHWTGAGHRLDRFSKTDAEAQSDYAFEELIAEIGSCFLCTHIGATPDLANSAAYVQAWLKSLKNDKKFIFRAATAAQKAFDYALQSASAPALAQAA